MLFSAMFHQVLLLEELDDTTGPSEHEQLMGRIRSMGTHIVTEHPIDPEMRKAELWPVRRRSRFFYLLPRLWHKQKMYFVRLKLYHPLWLGEDGVVYREYESLGGNSFMMRAEIELRDAEGLQNVLDALVKVDLCDNEVKVS